LAVELCGERLAQLKRLLDRHLLGLGDHHDAAAGGIGDEAGQLGGERGERPAADHLGDQPRRGEQAHAVAGGRSVEHHQIDARRIGRRFAPHQAQGVAEDGQLRETRRAGRELLIDGACQHPPAEHFELQPLAHDVVEDRPGAQVLHREAAAGVHHRSARRRHPQHLVHVLARVDFQHHHPPPALRQEPPHRRRHRGLAHAPLAGDHQQLQTGEPGEKIHGPATIPEPQPRARTSERALIRTPRGFFGTMNIRSTGFVTLPIIGRAPMRTNCPLSNSR
jgi:hypothetical protein